MKHFIYFITVLTLCAAITLCSCGAPGAGTSSETTSGSEETIHEKEIKISVPTGSSVFLNGEGISGDHLTDECLLPEVIDYSASLIDGSIEYDCYKVSIDEDEAVELSGNDPNGYPLEFNMEDDCYIGAAIGSEDFAVSVCETVENALRTYALFFIYQAFDMDSYIAEDCHLRDYILGSDTYNRLYIEYYNYEYIESYEFAEFEADNYKVYSDSCFSAEINYKLDVAFTEPDKFSDDNQRLHATWIFIKENDSWKLADSIKADDEASYSVFTDGSGTMLQSSEEISEIADDDDGIQLIMIDEDEYSGMLMIIEDPSRVFCGTIPEFSESYGLTVSQIMSNYNDSGTSVIAGVNGGNFVDTGVNNAYTAMPLGLVISQGEVVMAEYGTGDDAVYHIAGFTEDDQFIMGDMTVSQALELGVRDAVYCTETTGPFLIQDGEIQWDELPDTAIYGAGKNPRTAIGQREDGAVMMLIINGRQPDSLGASFVDLANIMSEYGAVNAAAMDGGTSSQMIYEDYILNHPFSPMGPRLCPTAWLVLSE